MSRTRFKTLVSLLLIAALLIQPVAAAGVGLEPAISETSSFFGVDVPEEVDTYEGNPQFIIETESTADTDELTSWVRDGSDRYLVDDSGNSHVVIAASPEQVLGGWETDGLLPRPVDGLSEVSYVSSVAYNYDVTVDPITSHTDAENAYTPSFANLATMFGTSGTFSADGVAYDDDVTKATMNDIREYHGVNNVNATGAGTTVAVLDTGINTANGEVFGDRIVDSRNFLTGEDGLDAVSDGDGHGTFVASQIAGNPSNAEYQGIAPDANLAVGKVLGDDGGGSVSAIINGVNWAAENEDVDVISMSLGSPVYSEPLDEAVTNAVVEHDKTVLVAAGNSRQSPMLFVASPADAQVDGMLSVAATNAAEPENMMSAHFSQIGYDDGVRDLSAGETRGAGIDISAIGMEVEAMTVDQNGATTTETLSGTSMATPNAAGIAALLYENEPNLTPAEVEARLTSTTDVLPRAGVTEVGHGSINAENAINNVEHEQTQSEVRDNTAIARDTAHEAYSGSFSQTLATWVEKLT